MQVRPAPASTYPLQGMKMSFVLPRCVCVCVTAGVACKDGFYDPSGGRGRGRGAGKGEVKGRRSGWRRKDRNCIGHRTAKGERERGKMGQ